MKEYQLRIQVYDSTKEKEWDEFVINEAINGSFLHTRNFLNYHPRERFKDSSLLLYEEHKIIAVIPACEIEEDDMKVFVSHKGSTYGGIVIHRDYYKAERLISIVEVVDLYLKEKYDKVILKITPDLFCIEKSDLLQYVLSYHGFSSYSELNTFIDLDMVNDDVIDIFDRNKNRNIKKCIEHNLSFRDLVQDSEITTFYDLLKINLSKYNLTPIHTLPELLDFKNFRIPNNVKFCGVFDGEKMMAAGMLFVFDNVNVIHAQNLSADYTFKEYSAITFLYYKVIEMAKKDGYKALSWGISTEEQGKILNTGLIRNKESYGSDYQLNRTYYKDYRSQV